VSAPRSRSLQTTRRISSRVSLKKNRRRTRRPHIETLEDRCLLAASPALLSTIEGLNSSDGIYNIGGVDASPPDPHGAVGPTHVVNVANRSIQWFTKDGERHGHTSLVNFFQPLRPLTPPFNPSANIFDPRVLYDQFAERFVVMALERSSDAVATSRIMMAVSDDSDPNGTWYYSSINTLTNIPSAEDPLEILPHYADFAGMAVNSEAIFVTANMIDVDDEEQANGSRLWIIDKGIGKGGLYENGRAAWTVHNPGLETRVDYTVNQENVGRLRSMYPAHIYGSAPAALGTFLVMYDGRTNMTDEFVDVIRVDNPLTNPQFRLFSINVGNLEEQPDPLEFDPPPEAPQPLVTTTLDVGDRRVYDAVWRDGQLYFTAVAVPFEGPDTNQTTAYWFRLDTTAAYASPARVTLADQGPISGEDVAFPSYTSFPSIAVDGFGNMAVSFALFGPGIFPSAFYALRTPDDPPGTLRDSVMLAEGSDAYELEDFDGLISWGRHTGLAIDPVDEVTFWTYNAYSLPRFDLDGRWGSRWGSFRQGDVPDLPAPGPTTIRGVAWQDLNGNGFLDEGEPVIPNGFVYVDLDGDGHVDLSEPTARTNAMGRYSITVEIDGPIIVREAPPLGWQSTYPGQPGLVWQPPSPAQDASPFWQNYFQGGSNDAHIIVIPEGGGGTISNIDFGRIDTNFDWGNAPTPWPTLRDHDGARHPVVASYGLGQLTLATPDGQPNVDAAAPDNDGVDLPSAVAPGDNFAIQVTNRGTGFLQGWIDWNGDGDWGDAGDQVLTNVQLTSPGTRSFNITVPANAKPGTTYARFRYGKQSNLTPTGASTREGEVEDYRIDILSLQPVAVDDFETVEQNSQNNPFMVLANDIPGAAGRANMRLTNVNTQGSSGTAVIDDNGTPTDFTDDFIRYTPGAGGFGSDSFTYTIRDEVSGLTDTARVSVDIVPFFGDFPFAVDDSYWLSPSQTVENLFVLRNDLPGPTRSISIPANGIDRTWTFGDVELVTVNDEQALRYRPNGFEGTDQVRYTIIDAAGVTSTGTVTIHVPTHTQDDVVKFDVKITDLDGNEITERDNLNRPLIDQGTEFRVELWVDDVRVPPGPPDYPFASLAEGGVFAAHLDLLFDAGLTAYSGDGRLEWNPIYANSRQVDSSIPGILNEIGAFSDTSSPLGSDPRMLFSATFLATSLGVASFRADPADILQNETLVYGLSNPPTTAIPFDRIGFGQTSIQVVPTRKLVEIQLVATDLNGNPLPNNVVQTGTEFLVSGFVQDIRETYPDGSPFPDDLKGVFSAYMDVLYPTNLAAPVPSATSGFGYDIQFNPPFTEGQKAEFLTFSGMIDEVGAFRSSAPILPNSPDPQLLFTTKFTALFPPGGIGSLTFTADPADFLPQNQVSLIRSGVVDPNTGVDLGLNVPISQVSYVSTTPITVIGAAGEGEYTNPNNPLDVNDDSYVTPMDALFVMNFLNTHGSMDLRNLPGGEGETGTIHYYDTNGDSVISPQDVLGVINYLNLVAGQGGNGEGEGEAGWSPMADEIAALVMDAPAMATMIGMVDAAEARMLMAEAEAESLQEGAAVDLNAPSVDDAYRLSSLQDGQDDREETSWYLEDEVVQDVAQAWQVADSLENLLDALV
jgi:hypothetical protein